VMEPNQLEKLETLFHALVEIQDGAEREAAAIRLSAGDAEFARRALQLVASDEKAEAANQMARQATTAARLYGSYRTVRLLGAGGMGAVYLAERADGQFQQTVAVKVIAPHVAGGVFRERFLAERQMLAGLSHPNITRLLDGGVTEEGTPYLVMEYVDGQPLDSYCDAHKMGLRGRLELFLKVCAPVAYAHRNLVVHRDLKHSNILVTTEGQPMLLDFGTAKFLSDAENNTADTLPLLTIRYSSPEQRSRSTITTSTDIFSLGVILYELLTGAWPFGDPASPQQMYERFARETPITSPQTSVTEAASLARATNPKALKSSLAGDLTSILRKALAPAPDERYESVQALSADIGNWLAGFPVNAKTPNFSYRAGKFLRRHWLPATAAAVFVLSLLGAMIFAMYEARVARAEALKAGTVTEFLADLLETQNPLATGANRSMTLVEAIDRARQNLDQFDTQPSVQADLHHRLGSAYLNLRAWDKAEAELRKAVESGHRAGDSEKVAVAESELALVVTDLGKNAAEADALRADALKRIRAVRAPKALSVYLVLGNHALVNWLLHGHSHEVEAMAREAIATAKKDPSVPSWRPATGEIDLASYLIHEGRNGEAEALLKDALDLESQTRKSGTTLGFILSKMGMLRAQAGDFEAAERYQHQYVLEMQRVVGPENEQTAAARVSWAVSLARLGRDREAVHECHEGLDLMRRALPLDSPRLGEAFSACAFVLNQAGQMVEAEHDAREAIRLARPGASAPLAVTQATAELGIALAKQHRYEEAIPQLARGEQMFSGDPMYGPKHHLTIRVHEALVAARSSQSNNPRNTAGH
jgi:serine/threonine protein kinase/tetratricopeptide (TPR) repeat protein